MTGIHDCGNIVLKCPKCGKDMFFHYEQGDPSVGMYGDYATWFCEGCEMEIEMADIFWKCNVCDQINSLNNDFCPNHPDSMEWDDYEESMKMMELYDNILKNEIFEYCEKNFAEKKNAPCICGEHVSESKKLRTMDTYEKQKIYPLAMMKFQKERV